MTPRGISGAPGVVLLAALTLSCRPSPLERGQLLLDRGQPRRALKVVRPDSAAAFFLRARALGRLGHLEKARTDALVGLSMAPNSSTGHRVLGFLEASAGNLGGTLRSLERSLAARADQPCVKRIVARLLTRRARLRLRSDHGAHQTAAAADDLKRAAALSPCTGKQRSRLVGAVSGGDLRSPLVRRLIGAGAAAACAGSPVPSRRRPARRCALESPDRLLQDLRRRRLYLGCAGSQLGERLEKHGCLRHAHEVWAALMREAPKVPVWHLAMARNMLLQKKPDRAEIHLTSFVFLSVERAAALNAAAGVLLQTRHPRRAGRKAVEALIFSQELEQSLESIRLLRSCGLERQARQAADLTIQARWPLPRPEVKARIQQITSAPPATP